MPEHNLNDLGSFKYNSMDLRLPKRRSFELNELYKQCKDCFWSYPSEKLEALIRTKMAICRSIIEAGVATMTSTAAAQKSDYSVL